MSEGAPKNQQLAPKLIARITAVHQQKLRSVTTMFRLPSVLRVGAGNEKEILGSLMPEPSKAKAGTELSSSQSFTKTVPSSRIQVARTRTPLQQGWHTYEKAFIRTGSPMPVIHALTALLALQCGVWAVWGMPTAVHDAVTGSKDTARTPHWDQRGS